VLGTCPGRGGGARGSVPFVSVFTVSSRFVSGAASISLILVTCPCRKDNMTLMDRHRGSQVAIEAKEGRKERTLERTCRLWRFSIGLKRGLRVPFFRDVCWRVPHVWVRRAWGGRVFL
jgi:hypothetical protein